MAWSGSHIIIENNTVSGCPNSGIRVNKGDYVLINRNHVFDNTWWSSSAESAIVLAESIDIDKKSIYKMFLTENIVHGNRNFIPYYNPNYDDPEYIKEHNMHQP